MYAKPTEISPVPNPKPVVQREPARVVSEPVVQEPASDPKPRPEPQPVVTKLPAEFAAMAKSIFEAKVAETKARGSVQDLQVQMRKEKVLEALKAVSQPQEGAASRPAAMQILSPDQPDEPQFTPVDILV